MPGGRRRRRRARIRNAVATAAQARTGATTVHTTTTEDLVARANEFDEPARRERPSIRETGPMLPEDLGRPASVTYDMTAENSSGAMGLDPTEVSRAFQPLLGRLTACAEATTDDNGHGPRGRVTVRMRVRPDGTPIAARVSGGNGPPEFITCVRRVVASARFAPFRGPDAFITWGFDVD